MILALIKFFIKKYIKDYDNVNDMKVRQSYGILSGVVGIICNLVLFFVKVILGFVMNSIAVISDAFNNLSDSATSVMILVSAKLSNKPPDKEHPYGHGRFEYIASLIVSFIIFAVGLQLLRSSISKIVNPEPILLTSATVIILCLTVFVKLWMYYYNVYIGKKINSTINIATAKDSINDVFATIGVIIGAILSIFMDFPFDGVLGFIISLLIIYTGFSTAKDSVHFLLGSSPNPEIIEKIEEIVSESETVTSCHDLQVHDYGPNRQFASMHVVVPPHISVEEAHGLIHELEEKIKIELGINMVIHIDPSENIDEKLENNGRM